MAFYWLISTHELERPSDWLISLHKRACGVEVGREQGGGRLLKFLGEADESTEIIDDGSGRVLHTRFLLT